MNHWYEHGLFCRQPAGYSVFSALSQRFTFNFNPPPDRLLCFYTKKVSRPSVYNFATICLCSGTEIFMKLTILRLRHFSAQDCLDLAKIWPESQPEKMQLDEQHQLYAAKFNDRLLAAVTVRLEGTRGELADLMVREVTRCRGVGSYLLEEVLAQNPDVTSWWMADLASEDRAGLARFMQQQGFTAQPGGWAYRRKAG